MTEPEQPVLAWWLNAPDTGEDGVHPELRQTLLNFLDVLDSLDRLVALAEPVESTAMQPTPWSTHLQILRQQLLECFKRAGVVFFECTGQLFDPSRQEAVQLVQRHNIDDYTVIDQLVRGCEWRGKVLRFARVVVARKPD